MPQIKQFFRQHMGFQTLVDELATYDDVVKLGRINMDGNSSLLELV